MIDTISKEELSAFLDEMRAYVKDKVNDAESKCSGRVPEFYKADMEGFARGVTMAGHHILEGISKKFLQ